METTDWKAKSTGKSKVIKQQAKTIKEVTASRENWKKKSIFFKNRADKLASDLKKIKDRLNEIISL